MGKYLSVGRLRIVPRVVEQGDVFHAQILLLSSHKRKLLKTTDCESKLTAFKLLSASFRTKMKAFRRQPVHGLAYLVASKTACMLILKLHY
jgi:hypothetical protein